MCMVSVAPVMSAEGSVNGERRREAKQMIKRAWKHGDGLTCYGGESRQPCEAQRQYIRDMCWLCWQDCQHEDRLGPAKESREDRVQPSSEEKGS